MFSKIKEFINKKVSADSKDIRDTSYFILFLSILIIYFVFVFAFSQIPQLVYAETQDVGEVGNVIDNIDFGEYDIENEIVSNDNILQGSEALSNENVVLQSVNDNYILIVSAIVMVIFVLIIK